MNNQIGKKNQKKTKPFSIDSSCEIDNFKKNFHVIIDSFHKENCICETCYIRKLTLEWQRKINSLNIDEILDLCNQERISLIQMSKMQTEMGIKEVIKN